MTTESSIRRSSGVRPPKDARSRLDDVDRSILRALSADARISNKGLAERVGIAQSTCLARVRALRESGVIRGFHADIDPRALGHDLQAMVAVRLQPNARGALSDFVATMRPQPQVLDIYFVAGANDYLLHVATAKHRRAALVRRRAPQPQPRHRAHRHQPDLRAHPGGGPRGVTIFGAMHLDGRCA